MSRKKERHQKPGAQHSTIDSTDRGYTAEKLVARTANQSFYMRAVRRSDVVLCYGPPGTGKTHIAVGLAVQMMRSKSIDKIIICRPVVPVGRDIGYLPGTMEAKVSPYLQPLFDELGVYCEQSLIKIWTDVKRLEIVPLSMMRGRTFKNCFVILDEGQNATRNEIKMFLTRIGQNSKFVIVGDLGQSDLPSDFARDYEHVIDDLEGLEGLEVVELTTDDIVRHKIIGEIEKRLC